MSWLKAIGIGLDLADAYIAEQNAKKLKELQMQGAAIALIEALIKELRNQIFNFKQTAEAILVNEAETPVIAAGAMKLLERRLSESGITPDVFQEITDKEYTATVIRLIRENSDRMLRGLSKEEQAEINHVASVASRLQDYEFYVENYQKGKELQKATEVITTYKNRQGCLPIVGLILYIYPGIAFPFLFAVMLGGSSDAGQSIVGFIGLGLWTWGLIGILKWKNGSGYKDANNVIKKHGEDFNLAYFNSLEKELGEVQEIKKRRNEARLIASNFFKDSSLFQNSYPELEENTDATPEQYEASMTREESFSTNLSPSSKKSFDLEKNKDIAIGILSAISSKASVIFSNIATFINRLLKNVARKIKDINLPIPSYLKSKKTLYWIGGFFTVVIAVMSIIAYLNPPLAQISKSPPQLANNIYAGTPIALSNTILSSSNIEQISQLANWGGTLNAITFSPQGDLFAAASSTGVLIYNATTFEQANYIPTDFPISDISFSPDGTYLSLSAKWSDQREEKNRVQIWNIKENNSLAFTIDGHYSASFSPNGSIIATTGGDYPNVVQLWNIENGTLTKKIRVNNAHALTFSPNGNLLAIGLENTVQIWDIENQSILLKIEPNEPNVARIQFSPDGNILGLGFYNGKLQLWDVSSAKAFPANSFSGNSHSLTFSPDGNKVAYYKEMGIIDLLNTENFSSIRLFDEKTNYRHSFSYSDIGQKLSFSPNGELLVSVSDNGKIYIWQVSDGLLFKVIDSYTSHNQGIKFSPNGQVLASGWEDGTVRLWKVSDGSLVQTIFGEMEQLNSIDFSNDGQVIVIGGETWGESGRYGNVELWRLQDQTLIKAFEIQNSSARDVSFSVEGLLAIGGENTEIRNVKGELLYTLSIPPANDKSYGNNDWISSVDFSSNGQLLATGTMRGNLIIWNAQDGTLIYKAEAFEGGKTEIKDLSFSPDDNFLAISSSDGKVQILQTGNWKVIADFQTGGANTNAVTFSPDGQILATSGEWDTVIKLWRVSDGLLLNTLHGHTFIIDSLSFSPSGNILASGGWDGTIKIWGVEGIAPPMSPTLTPTSLPTVTSTPSAIPTSTIILSSPTSALIPTDTPIPMQIICGNFISQLQTNITATVITDAINLREKPGTNQPIVEIIYTNDKVQITSEPPICGDGYLWWKVQVVKSNAIGWVVEGVEGERWLSP